MNRGYKILLATTFIANFADNLIGPFYSIFVQKIGGGILEIGYSVTIYSITAGILVILVGKVSDRINKKWITVLGLFLEAVGNFSYLFVSHPYQLFIVQIIFAVAGACMAAPYTALFARFIQKEKEGFQWALNGGGVRIIVGLSVLTGTYIVHYSGFRTLFLVMGSLSLIAAVLQTKLRLE